MADLVVTVAHSDWEKFKSYCTQNTHSYECLGHSVDGVTVRVHWFPSTVFNLIESGINIHV